MGPAATRSFRGGRRRVGPAGRCAAARRRRPAPGVPPLSPPTGDGRHRRGQGPGGGGVGQAAGRSGVSPSTRFDPDALASLESERDFLLRSIADLETEREVGNLDEERYRALKDDYTARAAAVLRSIEEGRDAGPAPAPVSLKGTLFT